jgi:hypothetical protein
MSFRKLHVHLTTFLFALLPQLRGFRLEYAVITDQGVMLELTSVRRTASCSRCSVYEWRAEPSGKGKTPMYIQLEDGEPFAFAGLWLPGKDGGPPTAAIITTRANDFMRSIHERMPVILER